MNELERKIMITLVYGYFVGKPETLSYSRLDTNIRVLLVKMGVPNPVFSDDDIKFIENELVPIQNKFNNVILEMTNAQHNEGSVIHE